MKNMIKVMVVAVLVMFTCISSANASDPLEVKKKQKIKPNIECVIDPVNGDFLVTIDAELKSPPGVITEVHELEFLGYSEHIPGGDPKFQSIGDCSTGLTEYDVGLEHNVTFADVCSLVSLDANNVHVSFNLTFDVIRDGGAVAPETVLGTCGDSPTECPPKLVFVTSGSYTGNLVSEADTLLGGFTGTGLQAGDAICNKLSGDAGLPGTYTFWGSDSTTNAKDRVSHSLVPYVLTNGDPVADDYLDLTTVCNGAGTIDCLDTAINRNESQGLVSNQQVWTSTTVAGDMNGSNFCDDWESADSGFSGALGITGAKNKNWTQQTGTTCNNSRRLYCFQDAQN